MVIVIPNQINGLVKILENLDKVNIQQRLQAGSEQYIELYLPKFKIKKELDLNPVLQEVCRFVALCTSFCFYDTRYLITAGNDKHVPHDGKLLWYN